MSRMSTDRVRHALNGPTMGTRWSALIPETPGFEAAPLQAALQAATEEVDAQMSTWKPESDLMRINAAPPEVWVNAPVRLMAVLDSALEIGLASGGAFDIGVGDAVNAWGFGSAAASGDAIGAALSKPRGTAHEALELDVAGSRVRKHAPLTLDLSGIAKGYGVDRLAEVARNFGVTEALVAIDGELRALGLQPDGKAWTVAIERPDTAARAPHAIIELQDAAVATSGDYRRWVDVGYRRLSHTVDPVRGAPLAASPASVTVVAATCMAADAWATALMVRGSAEGADLARRHGLDALFLDRVGDGFRETKIGWLFETHGYPGCAA